MTRTMQRSVMLLLLLAPAAGLATETRWHHPLYLAGDGYWHSRIRVVVRNDSETALQGRPVALEIGGKPGQADLSDRQAESVRLVDEQGTEMLFGIRSAQGELVTAGPVPADGSLVMPVECDAKGSAAYYIYFANSSAAEVPDFLTDQPGLINGDVELGEGDTPAGWKHDAADPQHRAVWTGENPQSGRRCLKTLVAEGAEPSWISTRQGGISIVGGARYRMQAWVRAEGVQGNAGWYIHVGNRENPMMLSPMLNAGEGTYGWKSVEAEFTAPAEADLADLGTVLRGTGTAWFDHVSLELLDPDPISLAVEKPERVSLQEIGADAPWHTPAPSGQPAADRRVALRVFNFTDEPIEKKLASFDASILDVRTGIRPLDHSIFVTDGGRPVAFDCLADTLLLEVHVPPRSVRTWHVYYPVEHAAAAAASESAVSPAARGNLVQNPGFEQGDSESLVGWTHTAESHGVRYELGDPEKPSLGRRSVRMSVPHDAPKTWRGWHQSVPVEPGKTYLLAAWLRSEDLRGSAQVHVHLRTANGELSSGNAMTSIGPPLSGTTDWTLMSGLFTIPGDAEVFQIHLTMEATGTLWHDQILLAEVVPASMGRLEGRPLAGPDLLRIWPVPAVVKVFRDDPAPRQAPRAWISVAGNEKEPLQMAIRGGRAMKKMRVEVDEPVGPGGEKLANALVNVVGFVPIDHPTSYYQSQSPRWHRKIPSARGSCDGWPGLWPDPLLPQETFDLAAGATQPVWITFQVPGQQPPGDYAGRVRLIHQGQTVAELPFTVRVWDFSLPQESHVRAIYDVRLGRGDTWGQTLDEAYPQIVEIMNSNRLCPDSIHPDPILRYEDGRVAADFTQFDKAAEFYFDRLKLPHAYTPWQFYLFGWGHPPKAFFGERPYPGEPPYEGADRSKLRPEYKRVYQACLKAFWDHLREKGWADKYVLYISDEPFDRLPHIREQMKALCDMIHEVDPKIPIYSSTWRHVPDWDGYLDVWGIGHYGVVSPEKMAQLRSAGARIWFTTDGQMCTDTPYCAVERLLPHYAFKYGAEAYEFWGVGWLTYNPYRFGWHAYIHQSDQPGKSYWVRYPNGDGFLLYPGKPIGHERPVSSVRFEQAREGVEDYEYLRLLHQRIEQAKAAGRKTAEAERALQQAGQIVAIPNAGGRYSSRILPEPRAIEALKRSLAEAIQSLAP